MRAGIMRVWLAVVTVLGSAYGLAQDTRTVTEPVFPPVCTVLSSQMGLVAGQPASETAFDTARIQSALTSCGAGKAVELASSGTNYAFLIQPLTIPNGVSLIVDGGVTVFASRNPADYQTTSTELCGTYGASGNGCNNLLNFVKNETGSGIYGYGVIDARGGSTMLKAGVDSGVSWWTNADQANTAGLDQDNPILMKPSSANNMTLYKITIRNSPMFHVGWSGTGFTAWGVKIQAPFTAHNTDGIDPVGANITITNSSISDGDDNIAVGASSASSNITISNVTTYSGHGVSVGSYTQGGLTNMLVDHVYMAGTPADGNATGIRLKSAQDRGGLLQNITYQNMCLKDMKHILQFTPFYNSNAGTLIPQFKNVTLKNIHFLAPSTGASPYLVQIQGHDANYPMSLTLNNVVFDSLLAANVTPATQYVNFTLAGNVYPSFLQSLSGTGVTYTGTATSTPTDGAFACPASVFPYVVGELYLSTASATSLQTVSAIAPATVTLNAMVQPAMSQTTFNGTVGKYTGAAALSAAINFLEGSTVVGTGTLSANGTLASLTLSGVTAGTHTYTAQYPGDTNYSALSFGSVTVNVTASTPVATTTILTALPATVTYGAPTTLSATVSTTTGTGSVKFLDGANTLATAALSAGAASTTQILGGGSHSLTAVYSGDTNFTASTSPAVSATVTLATPTSALTASPTSLQIGASTTLTATFGAVSGGAMPTGAVTFKDGAATVGAGTLNASGVATLSAPLTTTGSHSFTAVYGGDANYAAITTAAATVTVTAPTTTSLTIAPATIYVGGSVTFTATVASSTGVPSGSVTFANASGALGTGTLNAGGIAALTLTEAAVGAQQITATYAANGAYLASASAAGTLTVVSPITLTASPATASLAAGASTTATFTATPAGGFAGAVAFTCASPVSFVTCTLSSASQTVSGAAPVSSTATIQVASFIAAVSQPARGWYAVLLLPVGLLALAGRRRGLKLLTLLLMIGGLASSLSGCGGTASSTSTTAKLPPAGVQTVTITAVAAGISTTASVAVTVTN